MGTDPLTARQRSALMSHIRSKDTKPEMRVRRLVHGMGYRYRLHAADLPGRPDLVFRSRRKVIFVHGCFWHRHAGCSGNRLPKSPETRQYWRSKLDGNSDRDQRNEAALWASGWQVLENLGMRNQGRPQSVGTPPRGVSPAMTKR